MGQSSKDIDNILRDIKKRKDVSSTSKANDATGDLVMEILQKKAQAEAKKASLTENKELKNSSEFTLSEEKARKIVSGESVLTQDKNADLAIAVKAEKADFNKNSAGHNHASQNVGKNFAVHNHASQDTDKSSVGQEPKLAYCPPQKELSGESVKKIADFINPPHEASAVPTAENEVSLSKTIDNIKAQKKGEDYVDENFRQFFTQPVIVTKPPEQTNVEIKRKKNSFFKKKYITDSLSLNLPEEKPAAKASLPLVKTASDVWADTFKDEALQEEPLTEVEKPEKKKLFGFGKKAKNFDDFEPAEEIETQNNHGEKTSLVPKEEAVPQKNKLTSQSNIEKPHTNSKLNENTAAEQPPARTLSEKEKAVNAVLSRLAQEAAEKQALDKNPPPPFVVEVPAARIISDKEKAVNEIISGLAAQSDLASKDKALHAGDISSFSKAKVSNISKNEPAQKPPENIENPVISNIFTAVIEKQAKEALSTDEMTNVLLPVQDPKLSLEEHTKLSQEAEEDVPVFEEYTSKSEFLDRLDEDSDDILSELNDFKSTLSMRIILGFVCGLVLFYLNMAPSLKLPVPGFISPLSQPMMFYLASAIIFAIVIIGFLPTVISGFTSLKGAPAPDSLISLGVVMGALQLFVMVIRASFIDVEKTTIFASFIAFALSFNAIGKRISTKTIIKNLGLANVPDGINAGYIITDTDAVKRLARSLDEKVPQVLVSRKTGVITNFVNSGFSIHKSDFLARKISIFTYVVTVVCFILAFVISKNPLTAIFCATGAAALQIPLAQTLIGSVPSALMQKSLEQVGALVNGWQGIDQLSKTTHVSFDAKHLFPKGTVILHGIKTFEKERIDLAIIYAASVLIEKCEVLKPVFMEVIEGKTEILYPVENCEYIQCQGYVSWIQNSRVIIGNRSLMEKYDINMPPLSLEAGFVKQGRKPVYLAVGGKLFGMFVLSYSGDEIASENLDKLVDKGVNIILSSTDFNIDAALVEDIYSLPHDTVQVLNQNESTLLSSFTDYSPTSEACVAHLDSLHSLVSGFCAAESARSAEGICSVIQALSVIFGGVLALIFTYSQTLSHLPLPSILLLSFGWMGLSIMMAFAKKY